MGELVATGLVKSFASTTVVRGVDLTVRPGEVLCLLGENGAGKSTVAKMLAGVVRPDEGTMTLDGEDYAPATPAAAINAGVGLIHQETNLVPNLSIAENVFLGRQPTRGGRIDLRHMREVAKRNLARLGSDLDPDRLVGGLSVAALQKVEIAKALALEAKYLLLDEPTAALGYEDSEQLFQVVDQLRAEGVGFVFISHRLEEIARIGSRIVVMRDSRKVQEWDTADIHPDRLVEAMVDRPIDRVFPDPDPHTGETVLEVRGLSRRGAFQGVDLDLHEGEILGIAGLVGAGRTEVARALFGAEPADSGTIRLRGREVVIRSPKDAMRAGIALVPEDRKHEGLLLGQTVAENVIAASMPKATTGGLLLPRRIAGIVQRMTEALGLKGRPHQPVGTLSGGNQQKVVIAKWLLTEPAVVIFDEPTRGIDVGAKESVYQLITELAHRGASVIVISSELPEVLGLSHRVLVLSRGKVTGVLDRAEATQERAMQLAVAS
ncbi:sugar ABC transporter ATP-binding protein [Homoserinibacter sp. YIM 151385]|uniref:sugar ABC transporter ATP-binding protein n=1 Tax=Homoserinibacter sp. YIM 151385 TaxID=2985506 RepID=UPI0022F085C0|nr:sugar ABC transporter ATP-binding protein [Homoserinibacter sp. YIM 151385]WBU37479.1 sugar ABC transporter ATP-binding protein [Homoserinibacter sp. YIM 151385]